MKNGIAVLLLLFLALLTTLKASDAFAYSYYLYDEWGGTYYDAEKTAANTEDDSMCWAAAASNILAWTGWGGMVGDADDIFQYFQDHWTDAGGNVAFAWEWWFDGTNESQGGVYAANGFSQVDVDGGGFWSTLYSFSDYFLYTSSSFYANEAIEYLLHEGYGVTLGLTDDTYGHAITCWGYEYDENGNILGIYVTDSDDSKTIDNAEDILAYYALNFIGGSWHLEDFYGGDGWYIAQVQGLEMAPVPEPATILLLTPGLIAVGFCRKIRLGLKRFHKK